MGKASYSNDTIMASRANSERRKKSENCSSFTCVSPRLILSRWFSAENSRVPKKRIGKENINVFNSKRNQESVTVKGKRSRVSSSHSALQDPEEHGKENSFKVGGECGLVYLIAASRNELNKMVELHRQMEILLQNFRREIQNQANNKLPTPPECSIDLSFFSASARKVAKEYGSYTYSHEVENSSIAAFDREQHILQYSREKSLRRDQLEAELEVELDHLQLQMDTEFMLSYSNQQHTEVCIEETTPEESFNTSLGEVEITDDDHQPGAELRSKEYYNGVAPLELERRLHEVVQVRQEERIKHLEGALECAMQKLQEKERELSQWKHAAGLAISKHIPIPTPLSPLQIIAHQNSPQLLK